MTDNNSEEYPKIGKVRANPSSDPLGAALPEAPKVSSGLEEADDQSQRGGVVTESQSELATTKKAIRTKELIIALVIVALLAIVYLIYSTFI